MVLVRKTFLKQLKVQLSRLVIDSQLPHSRHPRLILLALYSLLLQILLTLDLLLRDLLKGREHFLVLHFVTK